MNNNAAPSNDASESKPGFSGFTALDMTDNASVIPTADADEDFGGLMV